MMILVTGATGFVGKALIDRFIADEVSVVAAVRKDTRIDGAHVVTVGDIGPNTNWRTALTGISVIVHAAARAHVLKDEVTDPLSEYRRVNVAGSLNLARQAAAVGVRRFVYVSSIKVDGESTLPGRPFRADDTPAPEDTYGISKWEAEQGLLALARESGMEVVIIRPPLVYGPGVKANFAAMMNWVARGVPLPLGTVCNNRRSLVALDNLVDLIATCIDHPAAANQVFLVADGEDLSTTELLQRVALAMDKRSRLIPVPAWLLETAATMLGKREVARRLFGSLQVDTSKTRELLGWFPPVSVDEGLRRAVAPLLMRHSDS